MTDRSLRAVRTTFVAVALLLVVVSAQRAFGHPQFDRASGAAAYVCPSAWSTVVGGDSWAPGDGAGVDDPTDTGLDEMVAEAQRAGRIASEPSGGADASGTQAEETGAVAPATIVVDRCREAAQFRWAVAVLALIGATLVGGALAVVAVSRRSRERRAGSALSASGDEATPAPVLTTEELFRAHLAARAAQPDAEPGVSAVAEETGAVDETGAGTP